MKKSITITRHQLKSYKAATRDYKNDARKKVAWAVFSYFDNEGNEYRKAFTAPALTHKNEFWNIAPKTIVLEKS